MRNGISRFSVRAMELTASPPSTRLEQLETYLREDPLNPYLLADACDEALAVGELVLASTHLRAAEDSKLDDLPWRFRRSRVAMARREWPQAAEALEAARELAGEHPVIGHDLAFVRFRMGDYAACRSAAAPWVRMFREAELEPDLHDALQVLWLRACHRLGSLDEAAQWIAEQKQAGTLRPCAAGIGSLMALDRGDFAEARSLADQALQAGLRQMEALVARASVWLAERNPRAAEQLLRNAIALHEEDGRAWSALGLARLQQGDALQARAHFERATGLIAGHVGTWHGLGWSCLLLQDIPSALSAFHQALDLDRNFAESHGAMGLAFLLSGRGQEAESYLQVAERLDRHNATGRYARAIQQGQLGDAEAVRALAMRLLDRPGFFGGRLSDSLETVKE